MPSTVSPVIVGAEAASPQPIAPSSVSTRIRTLSALFSSTPAILIGFSIGMLTAIDSTRLTFMTTSSPRRLCDALQRQDAYGLRGRTSRTPEYRDKRLPG